MALSKSKDESKSQLQHAGCNDGLGCLWPCQRAKMKANHNLVYFTMYAASVVYGLVKEQR
jgi:hypothetical protein